MNTQKPNKIGEYEILEVLGQGGMGVVYRARDPRSGRIVAIKVLRESFSGNPAMLQRFYREASQIGALRHNNIVIVLEAGDQHGEPYIVMELVEGKSLSEVMKRERMPLRLALSIMEQVCSALAYAHRKGVIHRDLKPSNVILRADGSVTLLDLGIARNYSPVDASLTGKGMLVGAQPYMAPEGLHGAPSDGRSDIFSAGVLLYELLTGKLPFDGPAAMDSVLHSEPTPPSRLIAEYPPRLDSIVARALAKSPADRYTNADDMATDLHEVSAEITPDHSAELVANPGAPVQSDLRELPGIDAGYVTRQLRPEIEEEGLREEVRGVTAPARQLPAAPEFAAPPASLDQAAVIASSDAEMLRAREELGAALAEEKRNSVFRRLEQRAESTSAVEKLRLVSSDLTQALKEFPNDPALLRLRLNLEPRLQQVAEGQVVGEVSKSATELSPPEAVQRTPGVSFDEVDGLPDRAKSAASPRTSQETRGNSMPFEVGRLVGDYEIVSMLGVGGMGQVYRVRNVISDRTEAMKVLLPDLVAEPELAARFMSEIRMLAGFDHPNIALLHTALQVDNQLFMVMEFVEGFTLEQRAKQGPIPIPDTIKYMQQVLSALSYAHGRGVVHRDIKPANIMVTSQGVIKLMDFGIAKSRQESELTRPGTTMGSLYYMSPEQVRGGTVDARSDLYSTGVMMYELFAGRRPFEADSAYDIQNAQCNDDPQPPGAINPRLPAALSDLILCAMAKDPAERFQNAQALSNALRQVAGGQESLTGTSEKPFTPVTAPAAAPPTSALPPSAHRAGAQEVAFTPMAIPVPAQPMAPPPLPPPRSPSTHRGAWIAVGALAVLVVTAGAAVGLPYLFHIHAIHKQDSPGSVKQDAPSAVKQDILPPVNQDIASPVKQDIPPPVKQDMPPPVQQDMQGPVNPPRGPATQSGNGSQIAGKPGVVAGDSRKRGAVRTPPGTDDHAVLQASNGSQAGSPKQPESAGPTAEEVDQAHEQMTGLDARASAVSGSVEGLKRQQEDLGVGLRQDMASAYARMNSYMRAASADLDSGQIAAARKHMDMADKEITILERLFGK